MCEEAVYDVVALGELLIDFTPVSTDGAGCPTLKANPGGAPGNLLAALSRYGRRTAFLGKVGEDAFGRLLLESLRRAGVQTRGIRLTSSAFTTLAFVTLDAAGDRSFSFARKPGADTQLRWEEVDRSLIQRCRLFHFGSLSLTDEPARSATRAAVAYARELGRTVTFDPNLRLPLWPSPAEARAQILWSLCQADVVKLSDEEVDFLWGCSPQEGARRLLEECGVSLAMVTLGPRGCCLQNRRGSCALTAPQVSPVDTTGAGDIFGGSALHRLLDFRVPPEELDRAWAELRTGGSYDLNQLAETLTAAGYSRCDQVEGVGQFALRGGILDVYSPGMEQPVRAEFFGDELDAMGLFDPATQRRTENVERAVLLPAAEALPHLAPGGTAGLAARLEKLAAGAEKAVGMSWPRLCGRTGRRWSRGGASPPRTAIWR